MTIQALHADFDVSPVAVGDRLFRRGQDLRAGEQNPTGDPGHDQ
jgi:hypothetical protein